MKRILTAVLAGAMTCLAPALAAGQTGRHVLVVINDASPASVRIGEYYAARRDVPSRNIVRLSTSPAETIERVEYDAHIEQPIRRWIARQGIQDQVLYIVLTKGIPIRIAGTGGRDGTSASVDSELSLLYRRMVGTTPAVRGRETNPYFLGDRPLSEARPFSRAEHDIYLVTRLDGYSEDDAIALVDRALEAAPSGLVVLDQRSLPSDPGGDRWLFEAAERIQAAAGSDAVLLENTRALAATDAPVIGYYSWGSNDPANRLRDPGLTFAPGALAGYFLSADGRTFAEPPDDWAPGVSLRPAGVFGSGSQSMAADLVRAGVSGMAAYIGDPFLDGVVRPQTLFPAYLTGMNLAEAYYLAIPDLSWQTIVLGDPLLAPYRPATTLPAGSLEIGIDPETELPQIFSDRQLALLMRDDVDTAALKLVLKAGAYRARDDLATTEALLLQAVDRAPALPGVWLQLAALAEDRQAFPAAIERYRRLLEVAPNHAVALNNLAFALAVHAGQPAEALPFAERALRAAPSAQVRDTIGWIHHLLGDNDTAAEHLEAAVAAAPDDAEILLHAAVVHAAVGNVVRARQELAAAIRVDPAVATRADVVALRERIGG